MNEHPILFSGPMVRAILEGRKTMTRRVIKPQPPDIWNTYEQVTNDDGAAIGHCFYKKEDPDFHGYTKCKYGNLGDLLWVRETFALETWTREFGDEPPIPPGKPYREYHDDDQGEVWEWPHYRATDPAPELAYDDKDEPGCRWRPSIFMPRWASRLTLEIVSVRVERVQDITDADALAEGIYGASVPMPAPMRSDVRYVAPGVVMTNMHGDKDDEAPAHSSERAAFECLWDHINAKRGYGWDANPWVWVIGFKRVTP